MQRMLPQKMTMIIVITSKKCLVSVVWDVFAMQRVAVCCSVLQCVAVSICGVGCICSVSLILIRSPTHAHAHMHAHVNAITFALKNVRVASSVWGGYSW